MCVKVVNTHNQVTESFCEQVTHATGAFMLAMYIVSIAKRDMNYLYS